MGWLEYKPGGSPPFEVRQLPKPTRDREWMCVAKEDGTKQTERDYIIESLHLAIEWRNTPIECAVPTTKLH